MGSPVVNGASISCSFGDAPQSLIIPPHTVTIGGQPAAATSNTAAFNNLPAFGMCKSLANPQVSAATSAASGVLTPQPCVPAVAALWSPGSSTVTVNGGLPLLTDSSTCTCMWQGVVSISNAGQATVTTG